MTLNNTSPNHTSLTLILRVSWTDVIFFCVTFCLLWQDFILCCRGPLSEFICMSRLKNKKVCAEKVWLKKKKLIKIMIKILNLYRISIFGCCMSVPEMYTHSQGIKSVSEVCIWTQVWSEYLSETLGNVINIY